MSKKLYIIVIIFVAIFELFVFRDRISELLNFGKKETLEDKKLAVEVPARLPPKTVEVSPPLPGRDVSAGSDIKQKPKLSDSLPVYIGRDPEEIRPVEEEVKLFSEEQKRNLYLDIENLGQSVKKNPDFLYGWIQLGSIKKVIGDYEGARDAWEYASLIRPLNSVSFANLGELYWRYLPEFSKSENNFRISIKNKPDDVLTYISFSDLYYYSYKEKKDLADDILLEGVAANPDDPNFPRALAALYERDGEWIRAIEWWKKVLEKEPGNTAVAAAIEALERKQ